MAVYPLGVAAERLKPAPESKQVVLGIRCAWKSGALTSRGVTLIEQIAAVYVSRLCDAARRSVGAGSCLEKRVGLAFRPQVSPSRTLRSIVKPGFDRWPGKEVQAKATA